MHAFTEYNVGIKYSLTVTDIFSKYGWVVPLKDKSGRSVSTAFPKIFNEFGNRIPVKLGLWVDKGKEFYNKDVKTLGVEMYSAENEEKSRVGLVERRNRTMKENLLKYFSANSTRRYIDV